MTDSKDKPELQEIFLRQQELLVSNIELTQEQLPAYLTEIFDRTRLKLVYLWKEDKGLALSELVRILYDHPEISFLNIVSDRVQDTLNLFLKRFPVVVAGGALVFTPEGYFLAIQRMGMWDLPKGKKEQQESFEECAKRETQEETGVELKDTRGRFLTVTRHFFQEKRIWKIKEVHWFSFEVSAPRPVNPQRSEGIRQARWISYKEWKLLKPNTFLSIQKVLSEFFEKHFEYREKVSV